MLAAFLAGVNRMPWRAFLIANAGGGIIWAAEDSIDILRL
jgi:membrane protein DedA with SNARE-associated domain